MASARDAARKALSWIRYKPGYGAGRLGRESESALTKAFDGPHGAASLLALNRAYEQSGNGA